MNSSRKTVSRHLIMVLTAFAFCLTVAAQKTQKTFKERFNVGPDAVLEINTSHADIVFETWNKDVVEIEGEVTLEGASDAEAETYFKTGPISILGNSKKIRIETNSNRPTFFADKGHLLEGWEFHVPEMAPFVMEMTDIAPFPDVLDPPPLPDAKALSFDYEAYKKDGGKYMQEWQKNFEKRFDKEHQKRLEEWAKRVEEHAKRMEESMREKELKAKEMERQAELMESKAAEIEAEIEKLMEASSHSVHKEGDESAPSIFYYSEDGAGKSYKIKKIIRIKLPKSTRIKMDVRYGEVKLANTAQNLKATLSHSSLWANIIDGNETNILASYSPLTVNHWNNGSLMAKYSKKIALQEVLKLQLQAIFSDITIDVINERAIIQNDFGPLKILRLSNDFESLDVSVKNAEFYCALPQTATDFYVKATASQVKLPKGLQLQHHQNGETMIKKGYLLDKNGGSSITLNADYSEVVVQ